MKAKWSPKGSKMDKFLVKLGPISLVLLSLLGKILREVTINASKRRQSELRSVGVNAKKVT